MKQFLFLICLLLFSMTGCGSETTSQPESKEEKTEVTENTTVEQETEEVSGESEEVEEIEKTTTEQEADQDPIEAAIQEIKPKYELTGSWNLKPLTEEADKSVVLLTIDDAPDQYSLQMAETLKELEADAIFFVNGHFLDTDEEKETLKKIHEMGFAIGNHTYSHEPLPELSPEIQKEEILKLNDLVQEITGEKPVFFRAPHGMNTDYSRQLVKEEEMLLMNWSYGYDWNKEYTNREAIADIMVNTEFLRDGSNLLMHDREWTAAALADIVKGLRDKGYQIVDPDLIQIP